MKTIKALKNLAVALGCAETTAEVAGNTVDEVINFIAENLPANEKTNLPADEKTNS